MQELSISNDVFVVNKGESFLDLLLKNGNNPSERAKILASILPRRDASDTLLDILWSLMSNPPSRWVLVNVPEQATAIAMEVVREGNEADSLYEEKRIVNEKILRNSELSEEEKVNALCALIDLVVLYVDPVECLGPGSKFSN